MAKPEFDRLQREQVEQMLRPWRGLPQVGAPKGGWIRTLREALGMSSTQLAKRLKVSPQFVRRITNAAGGVVFEAPVQTPGEEQRVECHGILFSGQFSDSSHLRAVAAHPHRALYR